MSRFIVEAVADDSHIHAGTVVETTMLVSVTYDSGSPADGLSAENFKLRTGHSPGLSLAVRDVHEIATGEADGLYELRIVPKNRSTWNSGVYLVAIDVTRTVGGLGNLNSDHGQTVARIVVPARFDSSGLMPSIR